MAQGKIDSFTLKFSLTIIMPLGSRGIGLGRS